MKENYFMGLDGFIWFTGVVENRNDPAKLGRVQVRCLGYHTEDLNDIPSADLPWAHVMHPVTDPSMQGLGNSPTFLTEGTWVVGFFRDANEKQQPIIMGTLPGVPQTSADSSRGFNDPNGKYPGTISHSNHTTGESDVSRLARGEDGETTGTSTGAYPFNHVYESESGHVFEIDDTSGGERLLRQHKSGTYEEIIASGDKTVKVVGNNFECVVGGSNVFIQGDVNLTTYGTRRDFIAGDYILEVGGKYTRKIHGSEQVKIGVSGVGNLEQVVLGNHGYNISGKVKGSIGTDDKAQSRNN